MQTINLRPHPATRCANPVSILVAVGLGAAGQLALTFRLHGDLERIAIPAPAGAEFADELWQRTCFEVFVATHDSPAYREFNCSPSGQWACYTFSDYRRRDPSAPVFQPHFSFSHCADFLQLDALLAPTALPRVAPGQALLLGLSVVIEATDGSRGYWALVHPCEQPDFHHRAAFALKLSTDLIPS